MVAAPSPGRSSGSGAEGSSHYRRLVFSEAQPPDMSSEPTSLAERRAALVEQTFLSGDDGLRAAFDSYGSIILNFCARTLGPHRAQDATQEVFISAWRSRDRFDPERGSLLAWLMGIARFRVIGELRSDGRQPRVQERIAALGAPVSVDEVDQIADRLLVNAALELLPERAKAAIALSFFEGLSHQEVSDRMAVPLGTVKSDIRRGLERLRSSLERTHG